MIFPVIFCQGTTLAQEGKTTFRNQKRQQAPDFTLPDINDNKLSLSKFKGKIVILNFWATWCPPCKKEIPELNKIYAEYKDKGIEIIGITLDKPEKVKEFMEKQNIDYPVVIGSREISKDYGNIVSIPTLFIIDKQGRIYKKNIGFKGGDALEKDLKELLKE
jgi:cytochrome c biogenesis protein CcmG/thiol:disulfide interchange protein DsbE